MGATGPGHRTAPVGDRALLVEFDGQVDDAALALVRSLDAALADTPPPGIVEVVPATTSLLVVFDPLVTDHAAVTRFVESRTVRPGGPVPGSHHVVEVCYDDEFAPDLAEVVERTGLGAAEVVAAHLAGRYTVGMYGFAPGYAYLVGVPAPIRLPRKPTPGPVVPAGSVLVTGRQCLVVPTPLSTGWFVIGRSPTRVFDPDSQRPFRFGVGDTVTFERIDTGTMRHRLAASGDGAA